MRKKRLTQRWQVTVTSSVVSLQDMWKFAWDQSEEMTQLAVLVNNVLHVTI